MPTVSSVQYAVHGTSRSHILIFKNSNIRLLYISSITSISIRRNGTRLCLFYIRENNDSLTKLSVIVYPEYATISQLLKLVVFLEKYLYDHHEWPRIVMRALVPEYLTSSRWRHGRHRVGWSEGGVNHHLTNFPFGALEKVVDNSSNTPSFQDLSSRVFSFTIQTVIFTIRFSTNDVQYQIVHSTIWDFFNLITISRSF